MGLLAKALRQELAVEFDYVNIDNHQSHRHVEPLELFANQTQWYLAAWDSVAQAERTFRIDRMLPQSVVVTEQKIRHRHRSSGFGFSQTETDQVAVLHCQAEWAWLSESLPVQRCAPVCADGSVIFEVPVVSETWLRNLILGNGQGVQLLSPANWRPIIAAAAKRALVYYE
jgi:proteasome accessory factor C